MAFNPFAPFRTLCGILGIACIIVCSMLALRVALMRVLGISADLAWIPPLTAFAVSVAFGAGYCKFQELVDEHDRLTQPSRSSPST